jgi:ribosomal protein L37AE/L43A
MRKMPSAPPKGRISFQQSLSGHPCPQCKRGWFRFRRSDGTNHCDHCGFELITEYEWQRRQKELQPCHD